MGDRLHLGLSRSISLLNILREELMATYNIVRLQQFFFEAALATYASGKKAMKIGHAWEFRHVSEFGRLVYVDQYVVNGEYSGGQTVILVDDAPAWLMQYHGWCKNDDREVLAFLKGALLHTYKEGKFLGGRGLQDFFEDPYGSAGLVYENWPQPPSYNHGFASFQGRERIWRKPEMTKDLFWHQYQGFLLG